MIRRGINYPRRNKLSTGVLIIRAGGVHPKVFFEKVPQCLKLFHRKLSHKKHPITYLNTCITYLNTLTPYLFTCINHLNTLTRLSTPYLNTCIAYLNTLRRLSVLGSISYYIGGTRLVLATNQKRVLRHPSRTTPALGSQSESSIT